MLYEVITYHELDQYVAAPFDEAMNKDGNEIELEDWKGHNYLTKNHVLNYLGDAMYDFYNAKENFIAFNLWFALEANTKLRLQGARNFWFPSSWIIRCGMISMLLINFLSFNKSLMKFLLKVWLLMTLFRCLL